MFRHTEGFKAQYGDMTLMIGHAFVEWHVVVKSPTKFIQGDRQFSEEKARAHALKLVESFIKEEEQGDTSSMPAELAWVPLGASDWLAWRP
jgi:hypothetical protein